MSKTNIGTTIMNPNSRDNGQYKMELGPYFVKPEKIIFRLVEKNKPHEYVTYTLFLKSSDPKSIKRFTKTFEKLLEPELLVQIKRSTRNPNYMDVISIK